MFRLSSTETNFSGVFNCAGASVEHHPYAGIGRRLWRIAKAIHATLLREAELAAPPQARADPGARVLAFTMS